MTTTKENFDQIEQSIDDAKTMRTKELDRFHIGDVVYPLYQPWIPLVWGTVVEIGLTTHKIIVNLNGIEKQFDPNELILANPSLRTDDKRVEEVETIEKKVEKAFKASTVERLARKLMTYKKSH